jgi:MoxR-like ATPase
VAADAHDGAGIGAAVRLEIGRADAGGVRPVHLGEDVLRAMAQTIVGQRYMLERLLVGLLANGHVLIEGVPGIAKTLAVTSLAQSLHAGYQRIQFTPDLLPADLVGTLIYQPQSGEFRVRKGPVFTNLLLADEINRAPAKVQSALLEAMQENQVTIGDETYRFSRSSCSRPRTRWSTTAPIRCPRRRSTASCSS